ncbi:MAG: RNA 2',3'-cyclic phosphodiesterase [Patescibacteria group bacterium]
MSKRRIFVALPIEKKLQDEILAWEEQFTKLSVRWLTGKNLHVTLVPPWYTEDVEEVCEKLTTCEGSIDECDIAFTRVSYGATPREPRLILTEGETPLQLTALKQRIENALAAEPEKRSYKLHLTLARFRPETFPSFPIQKLDEHVAWHQACTRFVLMESHLSRSGADYEILTSFSRALRS